MVTVRTLAIFALSVLAAVRAVAQSGDGAAGWTTAGPDGGDVAVLAAAPTNGLRLFAGNELGVFRTDDGAGTWTTTPAGPTGILALALDPLNADRLWAGTPAGIFESTDGGASFILRNSTGAIRALAVDPVDPSVVYAAGDGETISKSSDGGATWTASLLSSAVRRIAALVIDPGDRNHVLAAASDADFSYFDYAIPEVLQSTDAGRTWTTLLGHSGHNHGIGANALAIDPQKNGTFYAGDGFQVFRSSDGGTTWQTSPFLSLGSRIASLVVDPSHSGTLYAGTDRGAFRSTDGGVHWDLLRGPADFSVDALAYDADRGVLHAATSSGVWEHTITTPTPSAPCQAASKSLCLLGGRFSARIDAWDPRTGTYTSGTAVSQTDSFGYFSFPAFTGDSSLPEVIVKMVDAAAPPWNADWVLWGSLTDVPFLLTVTDTTTGMARTYENDPFSPFCGGADIEAFPSPMTAAAPTAPSARRLEASGDTLALLGGRIEVQIMASDPRTGAPISGTAIARDDRFGYFSLPSLTGDPGLPEVVVKAIDATSLTGTLWFFYGGMTSVPYTITAHNVVTGETVRSAANGPFCGAADTSMHPGRSE